MQALLRGQGGLILWWNRFIGRERRHRSRLKAVGGRKRVLILRLVNSMKGGRGIMDRWNVIHRNGRSGCIILEGINALSLLLNGLVTTKSSKGVNSLVRGRRILVSGPSSESGVFRVGGQNRSDSSAGITGIRRVSLSTGCKAKQSRVDGN
jgi:hypothetical protein